MRQIAWPIQLSAPIVGRARSGSGKVVRLRCQAVLHIHVIRVPADVTPVPVSVGLMVSGAESPYGQWRTVAGGNDA